jgi:hypothetical protein
MLKQVVCKLSLWFKGIIASWCQSHGGLQHKRVSFPPEFRTREIWFQVSMVVAQNYSLWFHVVRIIVTDLSGTSPVSNAHTLHSCEYVILTHCMYLVISLCLEASVLLNVLVFFRPHCIFATTRTCSWGKNIVWEYKIWDFDGGWDDEDSRKSSVFYIPVEADTHFRGKCLPSSSGLKARPSKKPQWNGQQI